MPQSRPPSPPANSFGFRLRVLRDAAGLTQGELAERSGLNTQTVWQIEVGRRRPSFETACRLADALQVGVEEFR